MAARSRARSRTSSTPAPARRRRPSHGSALQPLAYVRRILFRIRFLTVRARLSRRDSARVFGLSLTVEPGVFHPALFRSTRLLARYVLSLDLAGRSVLDMGTGSGIAGLCAARRGGRVVAVDA